MGNPKYLLLILLSVPLALMARAGTGRLEGVLNGYVTDAVTKKPLSGVIVSAFVPGTNSLKEVLTDSDGYFRFAELPASQVTVEFNKKGYQPCRKPNIALKEKVAVRINIEFAPAEMEGDSGNNEFPVLRMLDAY
ncbi:MAG TPA: carboxypeptidase-like regulatory domain-containing protein [Puia sp.]|jgi:hypothetical protein|nr:carboxypeptidase-like regulatory domain-containing protein [Puia sp.]